MRSVSQVLALGALALLAGCSQTDEPPESAALALNPVAKDNAVESIEQALFESLAYGLEQGLPGISAAIATRQGVIWTDAVGYANLETKDPANEAYLYGIGSVTKTFVAVVIHQLVDEGKLNLDATAVDILGGEAVGGIPNADSASIGHLLDHTSGIPTWEFAPEWIRRGRGADMDPTYTWGKTETLDYIDEAQHPATNAPGAAYSYSNSNHTILGLVIEKVTGKDAVEVLHDRILDPLGLTEIYLEGFEPVDGVKLPARYHFATPAFRRDAGLHDSFKPVTDRLIDVSATNLSVEWTAGGMVATARDLAEYGLALRDGRLLSAPAMLRVFTFSRPGDGDTEVSQGLFRSVVRQKVVVSHGGNVLGFGAEFAWLEDEDLVIVLLSNAGAMHSGEGSYSPGRLLEDTDFINTALALADALTPTD